MKRNKELKLSMKELEKFKEIYDTLDKIQGWSVHTCDICHKPNQPCWTDVMSLTAKCKSCIAKENFKRWQKNNVDYTLTENQQ